MRQEVALKHEFVEFIPDELEERTIYITIRFATASHLCCCGCGNKVVTPIRPTDWKLTFDGKTISLHPSIGNWSLACQSHYWIRNNRAEWAPKWSQERIDRGRVHDRFVKEKHFDDAASTAKTGPQNAASTPEASKPPKRSAWRTLKNWWS